MGIFKAVKAGRGTILRVVIGLVMATAATSSLAGELKLATFMSPKHPMDARVMSPMAEELAEITGGKLTIRIHPAGELGKGPQQQLQRAIDGVADIVFGLHGYTSSQFPRTLLVALPGLANGPVQATEMLWRAYDPHLAPEYERVKTLAIWTNDLAVIMTRERPVRSLGDLAGLKIRTADATGAKTIAAWGATPVPMPVPKVYNALSTGIVDGVLIGASGIASFKLHEVTKHITVGIPSTVTPFYIVMNRDTWAALEPEDQAALEKVTGRALSLKAAQVYDEAGDHGLKVAREAGVEIIELSPAEQEAFAAANGKVVEAVVSEMKAEGIDAEDILAAMSAGS